MQYITRVPSRSSVNKNRCARGAWTTQVHTLRRLQFYYIIVTNVYQFLNRAGFATPPGGATHAFDCITDRPARHDSTRPNFRNVRSPDSIESEQSARFRRSHKPSQPNDCRRGNRPFGSTTPCVCVCVLACA